MTSVLHRSPVTLRAIAALADAEGLTAHRLAAELRFEDKL